MSKYLDSLNNKKQPEIIEEILTQAERFSTPTITDAGINLIIQILELSKAQKVLEIGTAIGYSAIMMALNTEVEITTIEREQNAYELAQVNIAKAKLEKRINLVFADALDYQTTELFDLIFIDAAKAQYLKFIEKYQNNLKVGGIIICDNLLFHGLVENDSLPESKNLKKLVKKIRDFNQALVNHPDFSTYIYQIGDGMSISIKK